MAASVALHPAAKSRDRSIEARRAARRARFERERLIVDCLNRGVSVAEIAQRIGVTEKRARALVKDILARRMPAAPEDFAALQVSRLNEALLVAYDAMSDQNLRAVALVVRIVRELDRYHGFVAADRRPRPRADAEVEEAPCGIGHISLRASRSPSPRSGGVGRRGGLPIARKRRRKRLKQWNSRPKKAWTRRPAKRRRSGASKDAESSRPLTGPGASFDRLRMSFDSAQR